MSNAALCAILQALVSPSRDTHAGEQHKPETSRHNATPSTFEAHKHQRSPLTVHLGLPLCTHSSQPHYAGSNHHAPPPALALLRWCHLAYCQVGPKARALPHTRPTVRPSMANCRAGLTKASHPQGQNSIAPGPSEKPQSLQKYPTTASSQQFDKV